jgi:translocation and assembly module TamB
MAQGVHPGGGHGEGWQSVTNGAADLHSSGPWFFRFFRLVGAGLSSLLVFVAGIVAGTLLHMNTPAARRIAVTQVNTLLAPSFRGKIRIEGLEGLGLGGITGANVTIDDPTGRPVLVASGVRVRVKTLAAVRSALFGGRTPLAIDLADVTVDALDVRLDSDPQGNLELMDALAPREPNAPASPNARGLRLAISRIVTKHAWAHGQVTGAPLLDVRVDDFRGALTYAPDLLDATVFGVAIAARRIRNDVDATGTLTAQVHRASQPKADGTAPRFGTHARVAWQGTAGGIGHTLRASLDDQAFDAVADVPDIDPSDVRRLWTDSPIDRKGSLHIDAHGTLPHVDIGMQAHLGAASLDATGHLLVGDTKSGSLSFSARDVDIRELAAGAPHSRLGANGDVSAVLDRDGAVSGDAALQFLGGEAAGYSIPPASIRAKGSRGAPNRIRADAEVVVQEPGAPTRLAVHCHPSGDSSVVAFQLDSDAPDLTRVPELHGRAGGSARVAAGGTLDLGSRIIDAKLDANVADIAQGSTRIATASISARATGPVTGPHVEVAARARGIDAGGIHWVSAGATATGPASAPHVEASARGPDTPDIDARVDVETAGGLSLHALRLTLARAGEHALVTARTIAFGGGRFAVDDGRVEGAGGSIRATAAASPGRLRLRAQIADIDLSRVARLAHIEKTLKAGTVTLDTDVDLRRERGTGYARLDLAHAAADGLSALNAHLDAAIDGRRILGTASAEAGDVGSVRIDVRNVDLGGGGALSSASWREAWGYVSVDGKVDLARLAGAIPPSAFPFAEARGQVTASGHVARDDQLDITPDIVVRLGTNGLVLIPKTSATTDIDGVVVMPPPAWHLAGVDFDVDATVDGDTGALHLTTKMRDVKGPLGELSADAPHLPYGDVFGDTGRLSADLRTTPVDLHLIVPERGLGTLPPLLRQSYVTGKLQADVHAAGTMVAPNIDLAATIHKSHFSTDATNVPLDIAVKARYDGRQATLAVKAVGEGRDMAVVNASANAAAADFLQHNGSAAWSASARTHFDAFPLEAIVYLDDRGVSGRVSGDLVLDGLHRDARADANLDVSDLRVASVAYKSAHLTARAGGNELEAMLRVDQTDGFVETRARALATWGAEVAPALDPTQPLDVAVSAKSFRIAGLLPFVDQTFDELDGRMDADARVSLDPQARAVHVAGTAALTGGSIEAAAGGGQFHDVSANVRFTEDGTVTLEKLTAAGLSGHLEAHGSARLRGATLESARALVIIPSTSPIPVSAGGVEIGDVDGRFDITETTSDDGKTMQTTVEVPRLRVALPEGTSRDAQALGPMQKIRIGSHRGTQQTFVLRALDPVKPPPSSSAPATQLGIQTHLANVEVVRDADLKVNLAGRVNVDTETTSAVTGQIDLKPGGTLMIQGRKFTIEGGTVTFLGDDPSNPEVVVKAGWTAPDGTVIRAEFLGPLKTGRVKLTSEPTLPQEEIVQLLVFGSASGKQAQSSTTQNTAIGAAGGEAAQPLNHALSQLGLGSVTANVDTTSSANPRPEVEVQVARDISIQLAVALGAPLPGVNPDLTLLTVDWRFLSNWSLASTLGNAGTTLFDVLWQRRY